MRLFSKERLMVLSNTLIIRGPQTVQISFIECLTKVTAKAIVLTNIFMKMEKNKNEELQSRRQFFKKAAKGVLPIIGAIALANIPLIANASESSGNSNGCYGCEGGCWSCTGTCKNLCKGCSGSCTGTCSSSCRGGCYQSCTYK